MNDYRETSDAWGQEQTGRLSDRESSLVRLIRRQPEFVLAGSLLGGVLLALLSQKASQTWHKSVYRSHSERLDQQDQPYEAPNRTPSARIGASEEQMTPRTAHASAAVEAGATGTTEAIYEMDRASLTPG